MGGRDSATLSSGACKTSISHQEPRRGTKKGGKGIAGIACRGAGLLLRPRFSPEADCLQTCIQPRPSEKGALAFRHQGICDGGSRPTNQRCLRSKLSVARWALKVQALRRSSASTPYSSMSSFLPHRPKCCLLEPSWRMPAFRRTAPDAGFRVKWWACTRLRPRASNAQETTAAAASDAKPLFQNSTPIQ